MRINEIANPRQTILVSSEAEMDIMGKKSLKKNIITLDWHMPLSFEPMMYAISVGKTRFSCKMIKKSKCFVVNFIPFELKEKVLYCGRHSGEFKDKFKETKLTEEESEKIHCPRIKEALGFLECEVVEEVETGDHVVFIAKVVNMKENKTGKRLFHVGGDGFGVVK